MKYSFLLPYHDRVPQFRTTLESFIYHGYHLRGDVELIVVEDVKNFKNPETRNALRALLWEYSDRLYIRTFIAGSLSSCSPVVLFNVAGANATGDYLILTNPECAHQTNVLRGMDEHFDKHPRSYVIAACLSVLQETMTMEELQNAYGKWYQHSQKRNVLVHFCAALPRTVYQEINGFDENYQFGMCFDDDDFRNRIIQARIPFKVRDDLVTVHLDHYKSKPSNYLALHHTNKKYFQSIWGVEGFTAEKIGVENYAEWEVLSCE